MNIKVVVTLFFVSLAATAQVPPPPAAPAPMPAPGAAEPAPAPPVNTPAAPPPAAALQPQQSAPVNPAPASPGANTAAPAPGAPTVSGTPPAPLAPAVAPPPPVLTPVNTGPILPSLVTPGGDKSKAGSKEEKDASKPSYKEIELNSALRNKSPFMIPTDLYLKIKRKQGEKVVEKEIDDSISPKLRWPLRSYTLIGVLGGVKVPKALIKDTLGKIHTFRTKELIANSGGYISEIGNGEVIIVERGAEIKLTLKKDSTN